ncbi:hypothetical protein K3495_g3697 [Podosphaera aphanis]|nr:hypothetical protein K3495_g3697 [Podosphaera aphanis]
MSSNAGLKNAPLRQDLEFNWVFLVELILCGVLTLFFLFYFNRVVAAVLSYGLRAWTWHKYRVYIDIQSFQVSLLAGRVFFKGFRYHGDNETIFIQSGYITWRYWLRNVRQLEISRDIFPHTSPSTTNKYTKEGVQRKEEKLEEISKSTAKLPCRLIISLNGLEWFVYNRSLAYDAIAESLIRQGSEVTVPEQNCDTEKCNHRRCTEGNTEEKKSFSDFEKTKSSVSDSPPEHPYTSLKPSGESIEDSKYKNRHDSPSTTVNDSIILRFLPLRIDCEKAAVVIGNHNTKSVLVTKIEKAQGKIDATDPSSNLDLYKQLINIQFENPVIQIKPNNDYREDQTVTGSRISEGKCDPDELKQRHFHKWPLLRRQRRKAWRTLKENIPAFQSSVDSFFSVPEILKEIPKSEPGSYGWQGLSRYLDENEHDDDYKWNSTEYALVSTIFESHSVVMDFYWDEVGTVRKLLNQSEQNSLTNNINGDTPPEYGINLSIGAATINYGPWADRQRVDIQKTFFPSLCKDTTPATRLAFGQKRVATEFKLSVEFDEESVLRIPIKEASKNWKWTKHAETIEKNQINQKRNSKNTRKTKHDAGKLGPEARPFGWLDIRFGANSTISYRMDMVAGSSGYSSKLDVDFPNVEIMTSVNHGLLWKSINCRICCDLSNPLVWNSCRAWKFDFSSKNLELFLLREHVFLFTDLVDDWGSGPPPDYLMFCPFQYLVNFNLNDFKIYFNVNDSNIINNPSDFDDNTFVVFFGSVLNSNILIPLNEYRPHHNEIPFEITVENGGFNLSVPPWNTQATFLVSKELATLKSLSVKAKYQYCSNSSSSNIDTLLLDVDIKSLTAKIYGFAIRYLFKLKDNYFGEDIQFQTLEEYQESLISFQEKRNSQKPHKISNDLDVIMSFFVNFCSLILPSNLYSASNNVRIDMANLASDLRFTNYYMEYNLDLSTVAFSPVHGSKDLEDDNSSTELFFDGVTVFCSRLFGLPPAEPTYACNWDFSIGPVTGECSIEFLRLLVNGARAFSFSINDDENALPSTTEQNVNDVTFLRASLESVNIWVHVDDSAIFLSTMQILLNFNDWAGPRYSKKLNIVIPKLRLGCIDKESASGKETGAHQLVETDALVQTTLSIIMIEKNLRFEKDRLLQQEHLQRHDQRTRRSDFLLDFELLDKNMRIPTELPTMKAPPMPTPVVKIDYSKLSTGISGENSLRSHRTGYNSSILSHTSSCTKSTSFHKNFCGSKGDKKIQPCSGSMQTIDGCQHQILSHEFSISKDQESLYKYDERSFDIFSSPTAFSNTYIKPKFSLENTEPDTSNLPEGVVEIRDPALPLEKRKLSGSSDLNRDEVAQLQTSFIISSTESIRGFIKPKAVLNIVNLLTTLQAVHPIDLLDELQIDSISEILKANDESSRKVVNLSLHVPSLDIRLLNPSSSAVSQGAKNETYDQFDLSVSGLVMDSKIETAIKSNEIPDSVVNTTFTMYMSISSANFSVREKFDDIKENQVAINSILKDLIIWTTFKNDPVVDLRFKSLELATSCSQVVYIASLIHRTMTLATNLADLVSAYSKQQKLRTRSLLYLIATTKQRTSEPLFLTRPSYVLRSTSGHLRTKDEWMIIARLHHIYSSFDSISQNEIASRCLNDPINTGADADEGAQRCMTSILTRLKSWSLNNESDCSVISKVYGQPIDNSLQTPSKKNFTSSLRTEFIWLVVDPGPKQNGISISRIAINFRNIKKPANTNILLQADEQPTHMIILEVFLSEFSVEVNWELYRIAGDILRLFHDYQNSKDILTTPLSEEKSETFLSLLKDDIHVVFAMERSSINIDTINISGATFIRKIEASFIATKHTDVEAERISNFILAMDTITSEIKSHSQVLASLQLRSPCLNLSYIDRDGCENSTSMLEIAGNCKEISLTFNQDLLALMEVLDLVVVDEISQGYDILQAGSYQSPHKLGTNTSSSEKFPIPNISVALFLDSYKIRIPLLQSLTYHMSGEMARASVSARTKNEIILNFDIKDHSYDIENTTNRHDSSISLLKLPQTNGRILIDMSQKNTTLSVVASIDLIKIDAAVVHTLLTTTNRPEVSIMIAEIENNVRKIKTQFQQILHDEKPTQGSIASLTSIVTASVEKSKLLYNGNLTLAGFRIFATALSADNTKKTARLDLDLGCIQLAAMNYFEPKGPILEFPEFCIVSHRVMFELSRCNQRSIEPCGNVTFAASLTATSKKDKLGDESRSYHIKSNSLKINLFSDTASSVVEVLGHLQNKIKDLGLSGEKNYLRKLHESQPRISVNEDRDTFNDKTVLLFKSIYSLELLDIQISWLLGAYGDQLPSGVESEDLVLSLKRIVLSSRKENSSRLKIEDLQVQMVPTSQEKSLRSLNSALLPEIVFNVDHFSTEDTRRLAFQAGGKSLDLRLTSNFMIPASALKKSIKSATEKFQEASTVWRTPTIRPAAESHTRQPFLGKKRLESLFVDADFAGAVVHLSGRCKSSTYGQKSGGFADSQAGKYGRFTNNDPSGDNSNTILRSPGLAWKVEYKDNGIDNLSFNAEVKVDASSNVLYPTVVPLIMEISSTVKEIVSDEDVKEKPSELINTDDTNITTDPTAVLGRTKLNLGLRICRQEFGLSCQPISRVAATAQFDDIYIVVNTMHSNDHGHFLAASATIHKLKASVQHVYSREATGSFDVDKVVLSLMNSKHVSNASGISAILKISPMKVLVNAKQLQDFLLFREIWIPKDMRQRPQGPTPPPSNHPQPILVQRYQQVAATEAFPWNATVSITELDVQLNLGQAIGKSAFKISDFWLSSKKNSAWEQNLCIGIDRAGVESTGRMSGFVTLENFKLRTSIQWPTHELDVKQTPLIQASLGLSKLCAKAAFDYHAFLVADITSIHFLMYNVRTDSAKNDRLVAILKGEAVQVFSTTISASQALALYQAFQKLIQEKQVNFEASLSEIEKLLNRKSASQLPLDPKDTSNTTYENKVADFPISLHTDVIVILKAVNIGIFPNTFSDNQVLKLEAHDAEARFAVKMDNNKIHSDLGLTLGQLRIGLASVKDPNTQNSSGDISVQDVIKSVIGSREGTILKVPKVEVSMQTWQVPRSNHIDYIFKSFFEGKVEVGWNYSRISYIRGMWAAHLKALTQRLGKPLPPSAVRITSVPDRNDLQNEGEQRKITAEVNVPQSKYDYTALEPPIIETPQLRDMGEATPPLEWIGLHRDRLPNLTHQIVIVTLLELASEVDDAYGKILGSS